MTINKGGDDRVGQVDHIGIAIARLEDALALYRDALGLSLDQVEEIPEQKLIAYHLRVGESHIELLSSTAPDSVIARFVEKNGPGIHHIALAVEDFDAARRRLIEAGYQPIGEPSRGAGGKRIQFFHPKSTGGVLLEICSRSE